MIDTAALQLACRFALPPNSLGYCGKDSAPAKFINCTLTGECTGVSDEISKFIVLYPYLKTLSEVTGLDPFSYKVIEAYCLGNDQLKSAKSKDYDLLLENFLAQGVPEWLVTELKNQPPQKFIPFHLFQVLHVGVGRASGSVPFNLETINNCMVRWGKVEEIVDQVVSIDLTSLKKIDQRYETTTIPAVVETGIKLVPEIKVGDTVAVHWNQIIKILTPAEVTNLSFWTSEVLAGVTPFPEALAPSVKLK